MHNSKASSHLNLAQCDEGWVLLDGLANEPRRLRLSLRAHNRRLLVLRGAVHLHDSTNKRQS
jgi:hypothetical protein